MKLIALISALTFAGASYATDYRGYTVHCTGNTYDGQTYQLHLDYVINPAYLSLEGPYTIILNNRDISANLKAFEAGHMIYEDTTRLDELKAYVTDDQTTYDYAAMNGPDGEMLVEPVNWVSIEPRPADAGGLDAFSYSLNGATGTFKNAECDFVEFVLDPVEDIDLDDSGY